MKYNEQALKLSLEALNKNKLPVTSDSEIVNIQNKLLSLMINKFQEELKSKEELEDGVLKVKFETRYFSDFNDGYNEITKLVNNNAFDSFARDYCIYLGESNSRCDEWHEAYYEVIWDYKTYFEQVEENKNKVSLPYPVGSYVTTEENGVFCIDQIDKYVFDTDGLGVVLKLNVLGDSRLSVKISIDEFLKIWKLYDVTKSNGIQRSKQS